MEQQSTLNRQLSQSSAFYPVSWLTAKWEHLLDLINDPIVILRLQQPLNHTLLSTLMYFSVSDYKVTKLNTVACHSL